MGARGRRSVARESRQLADPPRVRRQEPDLAALDPVPRRSLSLRSLRRARLRHERSQRRRAIARCFRARSRSRDRGATAVRYAVAHPEKVSHLILYGAYAQGRAKMGDAEAEQAQRARIALTRTGWGQDNPVYRQLFTSRFIPAGSDEQLRWFNELCKITATAEMAARILEFRLYI